MSCVSAPETVPRLLVSCGAPVCKTARRKFLAGVQQFALKTSANVGDFLAAVMTMTRQRELLCDGDETSAFGFVTGYLPAGLRMVLRENARDNDTSVRQFTHSDWFSSLLQTEAVASDVGGGEGGRSRCVG